tara:strand:+ start:3800 stop:4072 length:273 start_codon:yes stop_codon:yes gene_type:complete
MKITNPAANQTLIQSTAFTALLSYGVPQVVVMHNERLTLVNNDKYSNTTSKHRNAAKRDYHPASFTMVPATPAEIQEITGLETPSSKDLK